jgi:tetratricopeptide (TPR) repeat protein/transcriptional regulator with XRE-family HTH domain
LTQEQLAEIAGLSTKTVRNLEYGLVRPRLSTIRLLVRALDVDEDGSARLLAAAQGSAGEDPGSPNPVPANAFAVRPAQLPLDVWGFAGRRRELDALDEIAARAASGSTAVMLPVVSGPAGVGKTALAVHWAHRVAAQFPDGQLYVNLRGFDNLAPMPAAVAVRGFLDAFDVPAERVPVAFEAQTALYRTMLAGKRVLVLLDNARDADQVRPLLPGSATTLVLVTSRNQLGGLIVTEGAQPVMLDLLSRPDAWELLTKRLGEDRLAIEPEAVNEIILRCARLPLALAAAAARAATRPEYSLAALAAELRASHDGLDALASDDAPSDVRAVFSWSYRTLDPPAARLFRLLGLHPGPDLTGAAAASLAGEAIETVRPVLRDLTTVHLVTEAAPDRYAMHDLLRGYAYRLARTAEPDESRRAARRRLLDHYLHTAHAAAHLLTPIRDSIELSAAEPGTQVEPLTGTEQALAWFGAEYRMLLNTVDESVRLGLDQYTWQLAWTMATFLDLRGHWHSQLAVQHAGLVAAQRLADRAAQAGIHRYLARTYTQLGRVDEAAGHLRCALEAYQQLGDRVGQARTHHNLGQLWERRARYGEALGHARQALDLSRQAGHRAGQALARGNVGWYLALLGEHRAALESCREALVLLEELEDRAGQAAVWDSLGYAHHQLNDEAESVASYRRALDLYRQLGDRLGQASTLVRLGDVRQAMGDPDAARDDWRLALTIFDELGHSDAALVRSKLVAVAGSPRRT